MMQARSLAAQFKIGRGGRATTLLPIVHNLSQLVPVLTRTKCVC